MKMKVKELTISEAGRRGGLSRSHKYADKISDWGKLGGDKIKKKYGNDYYKRLGQLSALQRKKAKEENQP